MDEIITGYTTIIVFPKRGYEVIERSPSLPGVSESDLIPIITSWATSHAQVVDTQAVYRLEYGLEDGNLKYQWYDGALTTLDDESWKEDPDFTPTEDTEKTEALAESDRILNAKMRETLLQTAAFTSEEFTVFAKAELFEEWAAGNTYEAGYRFVYKGIVYEVIQKVTALEHQTPDMIEMVAIYRPLSVDAETGDEPDGSLENPFTFILGMDVKNEKYYTYEGHVYQAKQDMPACVWAPDTPGLWQWELVE